MARVASSGAVDETAAPVRHVVLVSCVKSKRPAPARAGDLYTSDLFQKMMAFARSLRPDAIYILSAKHGLLDPDRVIEPYEQTLNTMGSREARRWADEVVTQLRRVADLERDRFTLLASKRYRQHLVPHLRNARVPLEGVRFGEQLRS